MSRQIIWNTLKVKDAEEKISNGYLLKKIENPFFESVVGLRSSGITFKMTADEQDEYVKCAIDIHYFAKTYCYIKGEEGQPIIIPLRDYQEEILDNFFNNRFNILMASRQIGKCFSFNTLCEIEKDGVKICIRIGKLYYYMLSKERRLSILEKFKIKLYDFLYFLEKN